MRVKDRFLYKDPVVLVGGEGNNEDAARSVGDRLVDEEAARSVGAK